MDLATSEHKGQRGDRQHEADKAEIAKYNVLTLTEKLATLFVACFQRSSV
jgi:hypothetical protein